MEGDELLDLKLLSLVMMLHWHSAFALRMEGLTIDPLGINVWLTWRTEGSTILFISIAWKRA